MSSTPEQIAALISGYTDLKQYFEGNRAKIDMRLDDAEARFQRWLDSRHVGFSLTDNLMDHGDNHITLQPRFATLAEAEAFAFALAEDYAPEGAYVDIPSRVPAHPNWFSEPRSTQFTNKASAYANIAVGERPHPDPKPVNRIALLHNQIGAHHRWMTTGSPTPNYAEPRVFMGKSRNANLQIKGQSYGVTNYDDLIALAENEDHAIRMGFSHVRIINLGPYPIHVKGFWIIHHGHQREL